MNHAGLRAALAGLGISHKCFADAAGLTQAQVSRVLNGKSQHLRRETRERLAKGLQRLITPQNVV